MLWWSDRIYGGLICALVGFVGLIDFVLHFFSRMMVVMWLWVCDLVVILVVRGCDSGWW